jgi:hypothetical protein
MTEPNTVDQETRRAQEALASDEGVGVGTTDEPDTFEPEEPTE